MEVTLNSWPISYYKYSNFPCYKISELKKQKEWFRLLGEEKKMAQYLFLFTDLCHLKGNQDVASSSLKTH